MTKWFEHFLWVFVLGVIVVVLLLAAVVVAVVVFAALSLHILSFA